MCEDWKSKSKSRPPLSLLLCFAGLTEVMIAIARWA
jgi:hypothetical protein